MCFRTTRFESGSLFETDFITNQDALLREIVDDFWRAEFYPASPLFIRHASQNNLTPESLLQFAKQGLAWPLLEVIPKTEKPDPKVQKALEQAVWSAYRSLGAAWESSKAAVSDILLNYEGLNRSMYRRQTVENDLREMETYLVSLNPLSVPGGFEKFCTSKLAKSLKGKLCPATARFSSFCARTSETSARPADLFQAVPAGAQSEAGGLCTQRTQEAETATASSLV